MTEAEREKVIKRINQEIHAKLTLDEKHQELERLKKLPDVIKYLNLVEQIAKIESDLESYKDIYGVVNDSLEKRINRRFNFSKSDYTCNHKIMVYAGSYYRYTNFENETDYLRDDREDQEDSLHTFCYNEYVCLECNKVIKVPKDNWQNFEKSNLVLKSTNKINIKHYQALYYQLLYNNYSLEDAQQMIIRMFNENNKIKHQKLVKSLNQQ